MQRGFGSFEKVLPQNGERVTVLAKPGRDLSPLTQVTRLRLSRSENHNPQALPL